MCRSGSVLPARAAYSHSLLLAAGSAQSQKPVASSKSPYNRQGVIVPTAIVPGGGGIILR